MQFIEHTIFHVFGVMRIGFLLIFLGLAGLMLQRLGFDPARDYAWIRQLEAGRLFVAQSIRALPVVLLALGAVFILRRLLSRMAQRFALNLDAGEQLVAYLPSFIPTFVLWHTLPPIRRYTSFSTVRYVPKLWIGGFVFLTDRRFGFLGNLPKHHAPMQSWPFGRSGLAWDIQDISSFSGGLFVVEIFVSEVRFVFGTLPFGGFKFARQLERLLADKQPQGEVQ